MSDTTNAPQCPKCGGEMWDNRASKRNPAAPDFKCKKDGKQDRETCDGVVWPERDPNAPRAKQAPGAGEPACPICQGRMWDNRGTPDNPKRNPKSPDWKCRDRECTGLYWPDGRPGGSPPCPKCKGPMWDNRGTPDNPKRNPKAPDFKCKKDGKNGGEACDGVIWPPKDGEAPVAPTFSGAATATAAAAPMSQGATIIDEDDDLPF